MSSRTSKSQTSQQQQQQASSIIAPSATRSTASTSRMRMSNVAGSSFSGSQGGVARTEPPRSVPAFSAAPSIRPSESASNILPAHMMQTSRTQSRAGGSRSSSIRPAPVPSYQYAPPAAPYDPVGSSGGLEPYMTPMGSNVHASPASSAPTQQRSTISNMAPSAARLAPPTRSAISQQRSVMSNTAPSAARMAPPSQSALSQQRSTISNVVPSTARQGPPSLSAISQQRSTMSNPAPSTVRQGAPGWSATSQQSSARSNATLSTARTTNSYMSQAPWDTSSNVFPRARGGMPSRAPRQDYAGGWVSGPQPAGISVGASPSGPVKLHYNQVDNRQLTITNNAPGRVTTTNHNVSKVDNSSHHNTHAPQANTYHTNLANVGNTHTHVRQNATSARASTAKGDTARIFRAA